MKNENKPDFESLKDKIIGCKRCSRLAKYISEISTKKVRRYKDWNYWGKPLSGFGDYNAKLLIIGLAPAAHGENRTGRMFTGDKSGDWLIKALWLTGFSNKSTSISRDDGLKLMNVYISAIIRCAPPKNKPLKEEIDRCSEYLLKEIKLLKDARIILTLGKIAFDTFIQHASEKDGRSRPKFSHGATYELKHSILITSYHPSKQNTQTGRLTWEMWIEIFEKIKEILN